MIMITEEAVEAAARAMHDQFWRDTYGDEVGTANVANETWEGAIIKRRISEARAALTAALPLMGVQRPEDVARDFDPDCDSIQDLVASVPPPTEEQLKVGGRAIDDYYNGTKDAPFEGSIAHVYRAMKALERVTLPHTGQAGEGEVEAIAVLTPTEARIETVKLLVACREGEEKPGRTVLRALRLLSAAPASPRAEGECNHTALILETREVISGLIAQCEGRGSLTNFEKAEVDLAKDTLARLRAVPQPPVAEKRTP